MKECVELLVILGIAVAANTLCGTYVSIGISEMKFNFNKLIKGLAKAICIAFAFLGLSYIVYKVPDLSNAIGMEPKAMILAAILVYVKKVVESLCKIFGISMTAQQKVVEKVSETVKEEIGEYIDM